MKVALCQIDPTVGDFDGNRRRMLRAVADARRAGARLAVFSELVVCGYPAEDLLLRRGFLDAHDRTIADLAAQLPPDLPVLIGCLERNEDAARTGGRPLRNAVALCEDGLARVVARKTLLPTYDVFDEARYFEPWSAPETNVVEVAGLRIGVTICEDAWNDHEFFEARHYPIDPVERLAGAGVDLLVNLSASPWNRRRPDGEGKHELRLRMLRSVCRRHGLRMLFVNQVGGNVGIQFDGGSAAIGPDGLAADPVMFAETVQIVDLDAPWIAEPRQRPLVELQHRAIVQGIEAYSRKFGLGSAVLGLSGGIDSALTAALAVDALGADRVTGIAMPSSHSSEHSLTDARELARNLGITFHVLPIQPLQEAFGATLADLFEGTESGTAEENLQSRARGTLLMAFANKFGAMLLTTGNKSEAAVGYCTLYGDTNGALAPIADLWKTEVWAMARWMNRDGVRIPVASIEKPPSAELRPDQLDTDTLPPYEELDRVLVELVEDERPVGEVAERLGLPRDHVQRIFRMVMTAEFKRFQFAPTVRVSERCWGGRRYPVSHRFAGE
ncbi:MAG: NAD+ synthase [Planctomycetes bacterium]|nr:NAD+ synthase [Planctomycetota bacterium]